MRIVADTSTLIRGLLKRHSEPAQLVQDIKSGHYEMIMTNEMAKELSVAIYMAVESYNKSLRNQQDRLNHKKYLRAIGIFLLQAEKIAKHTTITSCSDPEDAMFIECAIDGQAEHCISSDPSIFNFPAYCQNSAELALVQGIRFNNPQGFFQEIKEVNK